MIKGITIGRHQPKWAQFLKSQYINVPNFDYTLKGRRKFFTMGSCFAEEIRKALIKHGLTALPEYEKFEFDVSQIKIDELPGRPHLNYYNTFSIRQELAWTLGFETRPRDVWEIRDRFFRSGKNVYQDPYKRLVVARDENVLQKHLKQINKTILDGINKAEFFVFTFGMAEVFRNEKTGFVAAQKPAYSGGGGIKETKFHSSLVAENIKNIQMICDMLDSHRNQQIPIVLTVSPVPLERTFSSNDIFIANNEGKSKLRAAVSEVASQRQNVFYFPAFDIIQAIGNDAFKPDGRHIKEEVIEAITASFTKAAGVGY